MIDIKFLRENPDIVRENIKKNSKTQSFRSSMKSSSWTPKTRYAAEG